MLGATSKFFDGADAASDTSEAKEADKTVLDPFAMQVSEADAAGKRHPLLLGPTLEGSPQDRSGNAGQVVCGEAAGRADGGTRAADRGPLVTARPYEARGAGVVEWFHTSARLVGACFSAEGMGQVVGSELVAVELAVKNASGNVSRSCT